MIFAFTGFSQQGSDRVFSFELLPRIAGNVAYQVTADVTLARKYHITLQELPILCRTILEGKIPTDGSHLVTYSAEDMLAHATARDAAEKNRKPRRVYGRGRQVQEAR
jgi:hypothetical protein